MTETGMRLAIVGSTAFANDEGASDWAREFIDELLFVQGPDVVISGGAIGIDSLAAERAQAAGIPVVEHLPENKRWEPNGYKARNLLIAQDCTHLISIRHPDSKTYGSGWTADRAEDMGKLVNRVTVPVPTTRKSQ